jgi:hypothetical protein
MLSFEKGKLVSEWIMDNTSSTPSPGRKIPPRDLDRGQSEELKITACRRQCAPEIEKCIKDCQREQEARGRSGAITLPWVEYCQVTCERESKCLSDCLSNWIRGSR